MKGKKYNKKFFLNIGIALIIIQILAFCGSYINETGEGGLISPLLVILTIVDFYYYYKLNKDEKNK